MPLIRVLLVDDEPLISDAVRDLLTECDDIEVVGSAVTVAEAAAVAAGARPDVVLTDYRLPDGTGTDVVVRMRAVVPGTAVVLFTAQESNADRKAAEAAGAVGYLVKPDALGQLADTIRRAAARPAEGPE